MSVCSFCGRPAGLNAGKLSLCPCCRAQLTALRPESGRYGWYVRAVRRALFSGG